MKTSHHILGTTLIFLGTALLLLSLDSYGLARGGTSLAAHPGILGQVVVLSLIVGAWVWAMAFHDEGADESGPEPGGRSDTGPTGSRRVELLVRGRVLRTVDRTALRP